MSSARPTYNAIRSREQPASRVLLHVSTCYLLVHPMTAPDRTKGRGLNANASQPIRRHLSDEGEDVERALGMNPAASTIERH